MTGFFPFLLLYACVVYNLYILVLCKGGQHFLFHLILHPISDDLTSVRTSPLVSFFLSKINRNFHSSMCYVLSVLARPAIFHNTWLRYCIMRHLIYKQQFLQEISPCDKVYKQFLQQIYTCDKVILHNKLLNVGDCFHF